MKRVLVFVALLTGGPQWVAAQSDLVSLDSSSSLATFDRPVTIKMSQTPVMTILTEIALQARLRLTYDPALASLSKRTSIWVEAVSARSALQRVLKAGRLMARVSASGQVVIADDPAAPEEARRVLLRGIVRTPEGHPVESARIELVGTRYATYSSADGRFTIGEVPVGIYVVRAAQIGSRPDIRPGVIVDADRDSIDLVLERIPVRLAEVVVTPAYYGLMQAPLAATRGLDRVQLETTPQVGEDIYRAMSRLPGVAADDFSAKFSVRGATGDELFVTLDGLPLVEPFHLRDLSNALSIIDIQTLGGAELIAGGAPVRFGDHTGGVLTMETVRPRTDGTHGSVGLSIMNARAMAQGGSAGGRVAWLASARRGYVDIALKLAEIMDSIIPRYYDTYGKIAVDAGRFGRVSLHALGAEDRLLFLDDNEPSLRSRYSSGYVWGRWEGQLGQRVRGETVASFGRLGWHRDADDSTTGSRSIMLRDRRWLDRAQVRQDWTVALSERFLLNAGAEASRESADYDYFNWIKRQDVSDSGVVAVRYDTTAVRVSPTGTIGGGFLSARARVFPSLILEAGGRVDGSTLIEGAQFSPRLNAAWDASSRTTIRGAWGRHIKAQPLYSLQVQNGERDLGPADRAEQREISVEQRLPLSLGLRLQAYERRMSEQRPRWVNVSSAIDAAPEAAFDRVLIRPGLGLARGLEASINHDRSKRVDWSVAYTLSKVADRIDGVMVPRNIDQRHAFNVDWAVHPLSNKWRLTVAGMWHSGWPYTPELLRVDTLDNSPTRFSVFTKREIGLLNSERAPGYGRVDARWTRYFDTRRGRVVLFAEVFNLLDQHNVRGRYTNVFITGRTVALAEESRVSLGRLPSIGFSWDF